jgi:hypothetical protein
MKPSLVEEFLEDLRLVDEDRFQIVQSLRRMVLSAAPKVSEEVKYGGLLFSAGSPFCGVFSYTRHVSLEFGRGAELADPHGVLEGEGKKRRHIKIVGRDDVFKKNVRQYIEQAVRATPGPVARGRAPKAAG